ncbi:hypothetical protein [Nocardioides abyssi]|uniref:Uncharacterized protein n=1 Tax=Nocardioides abyssi TaxID=3058370 RepID=A0ABT8EXF6_9ACTN|nr:hypothetical protein [Nocardioides abyssi]MDN4162856.1 hypothetical protein [Nocardioides abyssi]
MSQGNDRDLAELRTVVLRAREQALGLAREAEAMKAELSRMREELVRERREEEQAARDALRNGQLPPEQRALVERIERGETTWRAVVHGEDDHWSAQDFRTDLGGRLEDLVQELRETDPEFRAEHDQALADAAEVARSAGSTGSTGSEDEQR